MVAEVCYMDFSRQFHLWKRERSRSYVTDGKGENGRKGRVNNKSNYFKTASKTDAGDRLEGLSGTQSSVRRPPGGHGPLRCEIILLFYGFAIKFVELWRN